MQTPYPSEDVVCSIQCLVSPLPGMNIVCFSRMCVVTSCSQWPIRLGSLGLHTGGRVHCVLKGLFLCRGLKLSWSLAVLLWQLLEQ